MAKPDTGHSSVTKTARPVRSPAQQKAFDTFFENHYRLLVAYAYSRGVSWHEADEVVSAALLDVDKHWEKLSNPLAYARKAVWSHICQLFRDSARGVEVLRREGEYEETEDTTGVEDPGLALVELKQWLLSRMDRLTPAMMQVIRGLVLDGMTVEEMSQTFVKSEAAIRKQLSLARNRLHADWILDHNPSGRHDGQEERG